jgi:hypothetical protein
MLDENPNGSYRIIGTGTKVTPVLINDKYYGLVGVVSKINKKIYVRFPDRKNNVKRYWSCELYNA